MTNVLCILILYFLEHYAVLYSFSVDWIFTLHWYMDKRMNQNALKNIVFQWQISNKTIVLELYFSMEIFFLLISIMMNKAIMMNQILKCKIFPQIALFRILQRTWYYTDGSTHQERVHSTNMFRHQKKHSEDSLSKVWLDI